MTTGGLMLSLERMNRIREVKRDAAGGRRGGRDPGPACMRRPRRRGCISRCGSVRAARRCWAVCCRPMRAGRTSCAMAPPAALCLGLEVVLADGRVLDLMSELHKDNSGYDLKDLFIGAEGTLGIITAAVMKLVPAPKAHATATLAAARLMHALVLLNRMQEATGGQVEAFEFMPRTYSERLRVARPDLGLPFADIPEVTILIEAATTVAARGHPRRRAKCRWSRAGGPPGRDDGRGAGHRRRPRAQRGAAPGDVGAARGGGGDHASGCTPNRHRCLRCRSTRLNVSGEAMRGWRARPRRGTLTVAHLGDGNLHFTVFPTRDDEAPEGRGDGGGRGCGGRAGRQLQRRTWHRPVEAELDGGGARIRWRWT
jgi:FAD/FMN-containing dehydrogenase